MIASLALILILSTAIYLLALAMAALFSPARASAFLRGFAASASLHYLELLVRIAIGAAFLLHAPQSLYPAAFALFGWLLIGTSAGLALVPWRWHQRFSQWSVPQALRYLNTIAVASLALGAFILYAALA